MKKTKYRLLRYAALLIAAALFLPAFSACDELDYILSDIVSQSAGQTEPEKAYETAETENPEKPEAETTAAEKQAEAEQATGSTTEPSSPAEITEAEITVASQTEAEETAPALPEDGVYDQKDDVALYIHLYGKLPSNYITKNEARSLGWEGGSVEQYAPGCCIGGDFFGNYENKLPKKKGRTYHECDIGTLGSRSRGAKRIIYSDDGLIYYTDDHYETFTLLYGEE